jgi:D-glycero-alpha-D-manno-heptose 1-phosphate guanylyltransferase
MQMVILCGGLATRLGSLAKTIPKSMIPIGKKPFLAYQIENIKHHGITDIVLCVGHLSEKIQQYFKNGEPYDVTLRYSYDGDQLLGPIGALKKAAPLLDTCFFTMYGDSYVTINYKQLYSYFLTQNKLALMTVYKNNDAIDSSNLVISDDHVVQYGGKKIPQMTYIDYGVSLFKKQVLDAIPPDTFYSTADLFTQLVHQQQLLAYEIHHRFYHIGTPASLKEFKEYIKSQTTTSMLMEP